MTLFLDKILSQSCQSCASRRAQLIVTSLLWGSLIAGCILSYQSLVGECQPSQSNASDGAKSYTCTKANIETRSDDNEGKESSRVAELAVRAGEGNFDQDIILEQLARNRVFLSENGLHNLRKSFVVLVGCGGVGSHAAAALVRSGVSRVRLIDFDQVTLSSLNRHALATLADVGTSKVHCIQKRLHQIAPWVHFDCRNEQFTLDRASIQLSDWDAQAPDYIIDAIDNIDSKVELLKYCHDNSMRIISSMGAGCKSDPTRVFIGDISLSTDDPLSRTTRRRLRAQGIASGIPTVFSTEKSSPEKARLLPLSEDEFARGKVGELSILPNFRVRILPVLGTMPAIFGLCIANHIILELAGYPYEYRSHKGREKMYDGILANLQGTEERLARWAGFQATGLRLPVTQRDVEYLVEEVYRGRSVISGLSTRLSLIRWRLDKMEKPWVDDRTPGQKVSIIELKDLVCMTKEEAARHEKEILTGFMSHDELYGQATVELVRLRREEEKRFELYR